MPGTGRPDSEDDDRVHDAPRGSRAPLTREAVLATARELVAADGLEALSLRRVARRLGVTAPALYAHVDDKLDLLQGLAELEFERLVDRIEAAAAAASPDSLERVRAQARAYVEHALEDRALFPVMFLFRPAGVPQPAAAELPMATKAFQLAADAVEDAMAAGALRAGDPLLASLAIWAAAHGVATVVLQDLGLGADLEARLVDLVIDNVLAGLAAPTG